MAQTRKQNYLHGAAILAASIAVIKVLGFLYKVPLGNLLGDEGFAHFNVAYNIYNVLLVLSTAGLPVAISRLISEAETQGRPAQVQRTFHVALAAFCILGALGTLVMLLFPVGLAALMEDVEAAQSIRAMAPAVLLVCLMSAFRGYAQGHSDMVPTSVSQVIEVAGKVAFGLSLAWYLNRIGKSLPLVSAGAIAGVSVGSVLALAYIWLSVRGSYRAERLAAASAGDTPAPIGKTLADLVRIGIPIAIGSSVLNVINLVDTKLVLNRLQAALGMTSTQANILFGVYSKAMTLYNLPSALITAITISVVPAISAALAANRRREAGEIVESSLRVGLILALPMGIGLFSLSRPLMQVIYYGSAEQGPTLLAIMGIASVFVCLALVMTSILQAHGQERKPVWAMVIGGLVKIALNWVLVGNPRIGIYGAPIGTLACYVAMCAVDYYFVIRCVEQKPHLLGALLRTGLSAAAMGAAAWAACGFAQRLLGEGRLRGALALCVGVGVGVVVYFVLIIATRAVTAEDMKLVPKGEKLAKLLHIR